MKRNSGLTATEGLVALVVGIGVLFVLTGGGQICLTSSIRKGQMTQTISNMKQLQLATHSMALDGQITKDTALGWPGDSSGSFSNWVQNVAPAYLTTRDLIKLLSAPGFVLPTNSLPTRNTNAALLYAVKEISGSNTVLFTTANFTNTGRGGLAPLAKSRPYGTEGFVVMRKDGHGDILKISSAGNANKVGAFAPLCQ